MDWSGLFAVRNPVKRRRALKSLATRLPCRPTLRFAYTYFFRLGILDGWPGLRYCKLLASYERMIVAKMKAADGRGLR
jgi:hypothetical protein